jgi:flagellar basal-body rod modification protein FlgD
MATPITSVTGATPLASVLGAAATPSTTTAAKAGGELGKDAFLQLLVAQLKYQDPTSPVDGSAFIAQTAQFTTVETLQAMSAATTSSLAAQQQLSASSLVGLQVTYAGADGTPVSGVVTSAVFGGADGPVLRVGTDAVPLTQVTEVTAARAS